MQHCQRSLAAPALMMILLAVQAVAWCAPGSPQKAASARITAHGFALHGDLKYPPGFTHFDYVNPSARKGGKVRLMGHGTFDTLNPYTLKGISPSGTPGFYIYGINELNETLLVGTEGSNHIGDEPQSAYGLLAASLEYPRTLDWVVFNLRPEARFHDGHPVDAGDVLFSYHTLVEQGHPRFKQQLAGIESVEVLSPQRVKVRFKQADSGADLLRFGEMPILPEHYWTEREFEQTILEPPLLSGPYRITKLDNGRSVTFTRVPDYWGQNLPVNRGRYNFDEVRFDFYRDLTVAFEAFKGNQFDVFIDYTAKNWAQGYDFPAVTSGRVIKAEIPHRLPGATQALFFNTRRPPFQDVRVRAALASLFDFEWTNKALFHGAYRRIESYFPNSDFAAEGVPTGAELAVLEPYRPQLPSKVFKEPFMVSQTDGSGNLRPQMREALGLLRDAGWSLEDGTLRHTKSGAPLEFEILMQQQGLERVWLPYIQNLKRLGIEARIRLVDSGQYKTRLDQFDFDALTFVLPQSLSPGHELREYFHSESAAMGGSRNYAGIRHPVVDALVERVPQAKTRQDLTNLVQALDRVLLWQHYMIPNWHLDRFRVAWWNHFAKPSVQPAYTLGFENWWIPESSR